MIASANVGLIGYIVIQFAVNALAFLAADHFVPGVQLTDNFVLLVQITAVIAAFNIFLKPILHLFLGPFILLTFGLLVIVINAVLLWVAAYLVPEAIVFSTSLALIGTALIFSVGNFAMALARRAR